MTLTRRRFHAQLAQTTLAGPACVAIACSPPPKSHETTAGRVGSETWHGCNFQASYMTWDELKANPDAEPGCQLTVPTLMGQHGGRRSAESKKFFSTDV